jgi:hypothetical protein
MKIKILNISMLLCLFIGFMGCETTPEALEIQKPFVGSEQYYANLRAYKASKHQITFGWFGGWTAMGGAASKYLHSVPDSVDLVSIWGAWSNLSEAKKADLKHIQQVKGTKVLFTVFAHEVPEEFEKNKEGIEAYAEALCDSVSKYNYDGLDLDYEPGYGGQGTLVSVPGHKDNMEIFVRKLSTRLGPASGTDKILAIDGVPYHLNEGLAELFDYGIVQAYYCRSQSDLQGRFDRAFANGWRPEQYIFTEDFERGWRTGGESYTDSEGNKMPSLIGMARFNPTQGAKGGCGSYHMEYEYNHPDEEYKYLREATQIMNPAK